MIRGVVIDQQSRMLLNILDAAGYDLLLLAEEQITSEDLFDGRKK